SRSAGAARDPFRETIRYHLRYRMPSWCGAGVPEARPCQLPLSNIGADTNGVGARGFRHDTREERLWLGCLGGKGWNRLEYHPARHRAAGGEDLGIVVSVAREAGAVIQAGRW